MNDAKSPSRVRPILRWPGGKSRMLKELRPMFQQSVRPHTCYCEVFAGGLALLMAKEPSEVEIVNDLNGDLVALYRNLQHHLPALLNELDFMLGSRQNMRDFVAQPGLTEIQRAARFLVKNRTSFAGNMQNFAVSKTRPTGALRHAKVSELLGPAHERLSGVVVENLPYERCLDLYDSPETLFFLDPPYLNANPGAYRGWDTKEMAGFQKRVARLKGQWVVTVDDSPINRDLFAGCRIKPVETRNGCVNHRTAGSPKFGELIITPK